jgi:plastocyanin
MEHIVVCIEVNGEVKIEPDTLRVLPGDTIIWQNMLTETYQVTNFSPDNPPLFGPEAIVSPAGSTSLPATVLQSPAPGRSIEYHYWLDPMKGDIDPVIIVEAPGHPDYYIEPPDPIPPPPARGRGRNY